MFYSIKEVMYLENEQTRLLGTFICICKNFSHWYTELLKPVGHEFASLIPR